MGGCRRGGLVLMGRSSACALMTPVPAPALSVCPLHSNYLLNCCRRLQLALDRRHLFLARPLSRNATRLKWPAPLRSL